MALTDGLVSYYKADKNSGTTLFDSVGSNDGTISGATWTTGKINSGLDFDGSNDYVDTGLPLQDGYTISYWGYIDDLSSNSISVGDADRSSYDNQISTYYRPTEGISIALYTPSGGFNVILNSGTSAIPSVGWYHIVTHYKNGDWRLYVNNTEYTSSSSYTLPTSLDGITLCAQLDISPSYRKGKIDEIGIWNRALTAAEASALYNGGAGLQYPFSDGGRTGFIMKNF